MNHPKPTIAVLSLLLVIAVGWIVNKKIEEARARAWAQDAAEDLRRAQAALNANPSAQPSCPPCRCDADAGAR